MGESPTAEDLEALTGIAGLDLAASRARSPTTCSSPSTGPRSAPSGRPAAGVITTAADLALWYQALLHDPKGLWDADTLADATGHVRCTFPDPMTSAPVNRTIGVIVRGRRRPGPAAGPRPDRVARAFGHNGAGGQVAWGDPETGLSFVYLTNGLDRHPIASGRRGAALANRAGAPDHPRGVAFAPRTAR